MSCKISHPWTRKMQCLRNCGKLSSKRPRNSCSNVRKKIKEIFFSIFLELFLWTRERQILQPIRKLISSQPWFDWTRTKHLQEDIFPQNVPVDKLTAVLTNLSKKIVEKTDIVFWSNLNMKNTWKIQLVSKWSSGKEEGRFHNPAQKHSGGVPNSLLKVLEELI